jgi:hypothetical protein
MEVIDWSPPQGLKLSNLNHLPKDTARQTESLKWVLSAYTQGKDIESWIPHIFENCLSTGAPRAVRVLSYTILRMIVGKYKIDWSSISGTLSRDISNHTDQELQVISVRILPLLPFDDLVMIVNNLERDFMKILCGDSGIGARIAYLDILPSILIKLWVNLNAEHLRTADMIREIYTYILTLMLESDDSLSRLSFSALKLLYEEREFAKSISLNHEFEGDGSYREMLTSLIDYLSPKMLPGILIILKRYNALNIRLRGSLFFGLCSCILDLVRKHYSKHVKTEVELKSGVIELKVSIM